MGREVWAALEMATPSGRAPAPRVGPPGAGQSWRWDGPCGQGGIFGASASPGGGLSSTEGVGRAGTLGHTGEDHLKALVRKAIRTLVVTVGAGAVLSAAAGTASAWPIPITGQQQSFINQARGAGFPGDNDQVLTAGLQACRLLYTGQGTQGAAATLAGQYGTSPEQAAALVSAAHGIMCTQAPG